MDITPYFLIFNVNDNVAVAIKPLQKGFTLRVHARNIVVQDDIPSGHKIALQPIKKGDKVIKQGVPIGSASKTIRPGQHVHLQNLQSNYFPTYTLKTKFDG